MSRDGFSKILVSTLNDSTKYAIRALVDAIGNPLMGQQDVTDAVTSPRLLGCNNAPDHSIGCRWWHRPETRGLTSIRAEMHCRDLLPSWHTQLTTGLLESRA
jgi:hypothetical protein